MVKMTKLSSSEPNKQYCNIRQLWAIHSEVHTCLRISWKFIHCTGLFADSGIHGIHFFEGCPGSSLHFLAMFWSSLQLYTAFIFVYMSPSQRGFQLKFWAITKLDLSFFSLVQLMVQHIFSDIRTYLSREAVQTISVKRGSPNKAKSGLKLWFE